MVDQTAAAAIKVFEARRSVPIPKEILMTKSQTGSEDHQPERRDARGEVPGSKRRPEEFDSQNPAKQVEDLLKNARSAPRKPG